jgi:hypothetical protein
MSKKDAMIRKMKTLDDVKLDMSTLYDEVKSGATELKTAGELANIAGKYLKAEQLQLAREIFLGQLGKRAESLVINA